MARHFTGCKPTKKKQGGMADALDRFTEMHASVQREKIEAKVEATAAAKVTAFAEAATVFLSSSLAATLSEEACFQFSKHLRANQQDAEFYLAMTEKLRERFVCEVIGEGL
ncbi:MAG: hypothetical protein ACRDL7_16225 [Gaiellaceae bacterium]